MKKLRQIAAGMVILIMGLIWHNGPAGAQTGSCHDAVNFLWPKASREWAHRVVHRESRGNPNAKNRKSTASGCFQILQGTWNGTRVGVPWDQRFNPILNTWVAMHLYRARGAQPWSLG